RRTVVALWHGSEGIRMLRIERSADADGVCFTISGRIEAAHLAELQRLIDEETAARRPLVLDLKDVKLIARDAVTFFGRCEAGGVRLNNCPGYLREWIRHEGTRVSEIPCAEHPENSEN